MAENVSLVQIELYHLRCEHVPEISYVSRLLVQENFLYISTSAGKFPTHMFNNEGKIEEVKRLAVTGN